MGEGDLEVVDLESHKSDGHKIDDAPILLRSEEEGQKICLHEGKDQTYREQELVDCSKLPRDLDGHELLDIERSHRCGHTYRNALHDSAEKHNLDDSGL